MSQRIRGCLEESPEAPETPAKVRQGKGGHITDMQAEAIKHKLDDADKLRYDLPSLLLPTIPVVLFLLLFLLPSLVPPPSHPSTPS